MPETVTIGDTVRIIRRGAHHDTIGVVHDKAPSYDYMIEFESPPHYMAFWSYEFTVIKHSKHSLSFWIEVTKE